ncbi:tubulin-specific chaperone E isoform X2 [Zootermopsis nevadensis]|uniref:tubulin-specific chaperone E isoform X2 n=1 Tax=Zootermopsis nevadensis TaxID=136037 RepID=UPI000B8EBE82|nr:tubulin-specific chaperone E isoform X2 [Zootermopsis nevadensis]
MVSLNTSNTMTHDDALRVKPGHRVESCGYYGTICYIGEVPPTKGIWLGVDWDDPTRGKHNGTHEAKKYFTTRHSTSGSFVRLEKVNLGRSFRAAIRNRYGEVKNDDTAGIDKENLAHLQRGIKARFIEVVGFDKVNKQQSQFEELRVICLRGQNVNGPGEEGELLQVCPNIQELDLSQNLLHSWQCLARIANQLRHLRVLNVSENQLQIPPQPVEYQGSFQSLEHVIMGRMEYVWSQILDCATMWPFVEKLQVPFNNITTLDAPPEGILHHLKSLDLEGNLINDWREINKLGQLPCLEYLNASDVGVKEVYFPVCETEQKTRLFPALKQLNLSRNNIDSLESMNELNKLLLLEELRFHQNPVLQDKSAETSRQLIIARIGNLKNLNGAPVTTDERKGAEIDYLKKHSEVWLREAKLSDVTIHKPILDKFIQTHPRYPLLVDKYGAPGEEYTARKFSTNLITVEIFSPDHGGRSYTKKLPQSMQVQTLIGMSQRLFDTTTVIPKLAYISSKVNHKCTYYSSFDKIHV